MMRSSCAWRTRRRMSSWSSQMPSEMMSSSCQSSALPVEPDWPLARASRKRAIESAISLRTSVRRCWKVKWLKMRAPASCVRGWSKAWARRTPGSCDCPCPGPCCWPFGIFCWAWACFEESPKATTPTWPTSSIARLRLTSASVSNASRSLPDSSMDLESSTARRIW